MISCLIHISIHAPCAGGDPAGDRAERGKGISIHAPCAGGDRKHCADIHAHAISIHAPCAGGDTHTRIRSGYPAISIHAPCAGGDLSGSALSRTTRYFNPRPLCRGRLISIPPPISLAIFQSTPPVQGATRPHCYWIQRSHISIHAPCAGGDRKMIRPTVSRSRFQSTPPVQGATLSSGFRNMFLSFQSTPPVQGAT